MCGTLGLILVAAAYVSVAHQWVDNCRGRFGGTHGMLVVGGLVGLGSMALGFRSDDDLDRNSGRVGLVVGFCALFGAGLVYLLLVSRGCGD